MPQLNQMDVRDCKGREEDGVRRDDVGSGSPDTNTVMKVEWEALKAVYRG